MPKYAALLRGIGPSNPNMHQSKLCEVLEALGFANPRGVISSGNVVFESPRKNVKQMEAELEAAWPERLGFTSTTIIRSQADLQALVDADPFAGLVHNRGSYLMVTFFQKPARIPWDLPYQPADKPYKLLSATSSALFTTTDNTRLPTTDLMTWLERQFGKNITSRTWLSVQRILKKLENL